ncbi:bifunctional RNase H/acid phosphatase [Rudaeicoccus suwonensis]|uniref:Putative phosphoglycerate mutase n=1 Tax=Rudaeicoccus suwonensis TaxID=657409 RepID=A0A561E9X7_9MICO|nr:bifunctional RNase H/acid phosphatase [Rudaeicoccus suwonensis]TWE12422.1 putative phosphoglycerate mutase [Rudaeicoccus suwonensis]
MGRRLVVEADGGSRGNPGVAGYGALVRDATTSALLAERAAPLGKQSNNVAEYQGMIAGLRAAVAIDPGADIAVRMDSKLVIEQMAGRWKIKHADMQRLAAEAQEIVRELRSCGGSISWTWIPRAENKAADKLSNDGMDGKHVDRDVWRESGAAASSAEPVPSSASASSSEPTPATVPGPEDRVASTPAMRLILVRHGVTDFTVQSRLDGRGGADPSLNAAGREQAAAAATAVADIVTGPVAVLTSSLARARETGAAIAAELGVAARQDADWDEQSFGEWDGLTFRQIGERYPGQAARLRVEDDFRAAGGESHVELADRIAQARKRAIAIGGTVVVATHRKPIMTVLQSLLGISTGHAWLINIDPASLTAIDVRADGTATVTWVNDTHHLR